jgi:hypothetical protein
LNKLLGLFLIAGVIGFIPNTSLPFRQCLELCNEYVLMMFIGIFFIKNIWIKLFYIWSLILMITNPLPPHQCAYFTMQKIFLGTMYYQILIDRFKKDIIPFILDIICFLSLMQIILMTMQYFGVWFYIKPLNPTYYSVSGFLGNPNIAGSLIALSLPAFLKRKYLLPVFFWGLFMSKSMGAIVPVVIGLIIYGFYIYGKKGCIILGALIILFSCYVYKYETWKPVNQDGVNESIWGGNTRLLNYKTMVKDIIFRTPKRYLTGYGLGNFKKIYPVYQKYSDMHKNTYPWKCPELWKQAHNEYLQLAIETGVIGLFLITGYLIWLILKYFSGPYNYISMLIFIGLVVTIINSGFNFLFHTTVGFIGITYFAFLEILSKGGHNEEKIGVC